MEEYLASKFCAYICRGRILSLIEAYCRIHFSSGWTSAKSESSESGKATSSRASERRRAGQCAGPAPRHEYYGWVCRALQRRHYGGTCRKSGGCHRGAPRGGFPHFLKLAITSDSSRYRITISLYPTPLTRKWLALSSMR
jgi:hypothetical protein